MCGSVVLIDTISLTRTLLPRPSCKEPKSVSFKCNSGAMTRSLSGGIMPHAAFSTRGIQLMLEYS